MDPFIGEIRMVGFNFAPRGWAACNGQLMPISQNTALFSILGVMYGGDGKSTFALPDLEGRAPMMWGQGPGLTDRREGESGGAETVTLLESEMPMHSHQVAGLPGGRTGGGTTGSPTDAVVAGASSGSFYSSQTVADATMSPLSLQPAGGGLPHSNRQPYLGVMFCIALQGVFPARS